MDSIAEHNRRGIKRIACSGDTGFQRTDHVVDTGCDCMGVSRAHIWKMLEKEFSKLSVCLYICSQNTCCMFAKNCKQQTGPLLFIDFRCVALMCPKYCRNIGAKFLKGSKNVLLDQGHFCRWGVAKGQHTSSFQ